jgi:transcriptional regulator MraZ
VLKGTYRHRIDAKGRLPVPAAFRRALAEAGPPTLVVTPLDQCLAAYPLPEWARLEQQLAQLPPFSGPAKALTRLVTSRAVDCDLDVQGRVLLPLSLRAAAGLEGEAVIIGVLNRFEVWSPERWESFLADSERLLDDATLGVEWPPSPKPKR